MLPAPVPVRRPRGLRIPCAALLLGILAAAASAEGAAAQEWKLDTNLSQRFVYSDNLLLGRQNEIETFGSVTTPALRLERNSPTLNLSLDGAFDFARYFDAPGFNSEDQRLRFNASQTLSERASWGLSSRFVHDTLLRSENNENGRFVEDPTELISWDVRPSWTYRLSPVDQLSLSGSYLSNTYDGTDKVDYQYYGGTAQLGHRLSEIDQVTASLSYFRYVPDSTEGDGDETATNTMSALIGYGYEPSERLALSGAIGAGYSIREGVSDGSDDTGLGFRAKFNGRYEITDITSLTFNLSHDSEPGNDGDYETRNRASLGFNQALTPMTRFSLDFQYSDTFDYAGINGDPSDDGADSRFFSVRPGLNWRLTEDVSLAAEYQFRYKLYDDGTDPAMANAVFLNLRWALPTWAWDGY